MRLVRASPPPTKSVSSAESAKACQSGWPVAASTTLGSDIRMPSVAIRMPHTNSTGRRSITGVVARAPSPPATAVARPRAASDVGQLTCSRIADHRQELAAGRRVVAKDADHRAGHHGDAGLVDAARGHALVRALDDHGDALGLQ